MDGVMVTKELFDDAGQNFGDKDVDDPVQPCQNPPLRTFQIALVQRIAAADEGRVKWSASLMSDIVVQIRKILVPLRPGGRAYTLNVSWSLTQAQLRAFDAVIYFVADPQRSLAAKIAGVPGGPDSAAGWTTTTPSDGVLSEVYVENNLPAGKLGNIALHELLHAKLEVGRNLGITVHTMDGANNTASIANVDHVTQASVLGARSGPALSLHLFDAVPMYTKKM